MRDTDGTTLNQPLSPAEKAMLEELTDQELNRKVLERIGERAHADEVDIDDI